ncbi:hypothetical protein P8452_29331 [Trifolium repens]|nr:hypothetical protein P8452_29331 [Trifolium repens]
MFEIVGGYSSEMKLIETRFRIGIWELGFGGSQGNICVLSEVGSTSFVFVFLSGAVSDGGVFPAVECFFPVLLFPVQIWFSSEVNVMVWWGCCEEGEENDFKLSLSVRGKETNMEPNTLWI